MHYTPAIWFLLIVGGIHILIALYCRKHRNIPVARPLELLMWCAAVWPLDYALDLMTETLWIKVVLMQIRFLTIPFIGVLELLFTLTYLRKEHLIKGWRLGLLLLIPISTVLLASTTWYHHLFRYDYHVVMSGSLPILMYNNGLGYQIYILYTYLVILATLILLITVQPAPHTLYRRQRLLIIIAILIPTGFDLLFQFGWNPYKGVTAAPFFLVISGLLFAYAIFRYSLLELIPLARSKVVDVMHAPMIVIDKRGFISDLNPAAASLLRVSQPDAIGKQITQLLHLFPSILSLVSNPSPCSQEIRTGRGADEQFFEAIVDTLQNESGTIIGKMVVLQEITRMKQAESFFLHYNEDLEKEVSIRTEELHQIIHEKEALLKEIHHRVKNNMQIISSLLYIQAKGTTSPIANEILLESQNRIRSISLVHEYLYHSPDVSKIAFEEILQKIVWHLIETSPYRPECIHRNISAKNVYLTIDQAVPCSLILNEMISYSLKYAFSPIGEGTITINIKADTHITIIYQDDGIGIPEIYDGDRTKPIGMQLIIGLVKQINGSFDLDQSNGTKYTIIFPG